MTSHNAALDLIRTIAITFVVAAHFFLNTPFNQTPYGGAEMFLLGMGQTLFLTNVCLFMMLTGYLNGNKTVNRKYYKGGLRVLVSYLLLSMLTILVSYIFDALYYPLVRDYLFGGKTPFLLTFLVTVPMVLLSSYVVAWVTERIRRNIAHQ